MLGEVQISVQEVFSCPGSFRRWKKAGLLLDGSKIISTESFVRTREWPRSRKSLVAYGTISCGLRCICNSCIITHLKAEVRFSLWTFILISIRFCQAWANYTSRQLLRNSLRKGTENLMMGCSTLRYIHHLSMSCLFYAYNLSWQDTVCFFCWAHP